MIDRVKHDLHDGYHLRVMTGMVVSLLTLIAAVHLWPPELAPAPADLGYRTSEQELILLEEITPTRQTLDERPPPPAPLPPVAVPDDVILEEDVIDFTDNMLDIADPGAALRLPGPPGDRNPGPTAATFVAPKAMRLAEPEYTREARRRRIKAEVIVEVQVDETGRVTDTKIVERFLLSDDAPKQAVAELGYGLEEAARAAAERWLFRPARRDGKPVSASALLTFRFGV